MKENKKVNQKETLIKVLRYIKPYSWLMILTVVMAAISVALTLYLPILTGKAVDWIAGILVQGSKSAQEAGEVLEAGVGNDWSVFFKILRNMGIVIALTALTQWVMNICNNHITYNVVQDIREDAFHKLERLPLKYFVMAWPR